MPGQAPPGRTDAEAGPAAPWREAMATALYGPAGFYRRGRGAGLDFRTSATASARLARALATLAVDVDAALGRPDPFDLVDVGAGDGRLLAAMLDALATFGPALHARIRPVAVEVRARPPGVARAVGWSATLPVHRRGLLLALEWLDVVPLDVCVTTATGPRLLQVDPGGRESVNGPPAAADLAWLDDWWPLPAAPGARAEIGRTRDEAWAGAVAALDAGVALAVDYGHDLAARRAGRYDGGTLTGYRAGRPVPPVPDGGSDLTAHVALDARAAAGRGAGATGSLLARQHDVLPALGVRGRRPAWHSAAATPRQRLAGLAAAAEEAELLDPGGLGGHGWLVQSVGVALPERLTRPARDDVP